MYIKSWHLICTCSHKSNSQIVFHLLSHKWGTSDCVDFSAMHQNQIHENDLIKLSATATGEEKGNRKRRWWSQCSNESRYWWWWVLICIHISIIFFSIIVWSEKTWADRKKNTSFKHYYFIILYENHTLVLSYTLEIYLLYQYCNKMSWSY